MSIPASLLTSGAGGKNSFELAQKAQTGDLKSNTSNGDIVFGGNSKNNNYALYGVIGLAFFFLMVNR